MYGRKLKDARIYDENGALLGVAEAELPDIELITEEIDEFAVAGKPEIPLAGYTDKLTMKIKFTAPTPKASALREPRQHTITIHASIEGYDPVKGETVRMPTRTVIRGMPKKIPILGKLQKGKPTDMEFEFAVHYIKHEENNVEVLEVDVFNLIFKVNGVDYLAETREHLGMS